MSDKNMTLIEFLDEYILFEKPQKYDSETGLSKYDMMCNDEKRPLRQELFESLILRINLLFDLCLTNKQLVIKSDVEYKEGKEFLTYKEIPIFENLNILEQELFRCLLQELPKNLNGTELFHSLKMYDWRNVPENVRMKLLYYIKGLIKFESTLFDSIGDSMQIFQNSCLKLEKPEIYFLKESINALVESENLFDKYPPKFLKNYSIEVDAYKQSKEKALNVVVKKLKQLLVQQNRLLKKLDNKLKAEYKLQSEYQKKYDAVTTTADRKEELSIIAKERNDLLDDSKFYENLNEKIVKLIDEQLND